MVSASVWVMKSLTCIPAQLLTGHFSFSLPPIKWLKTKHFAFLYFWKSKVQTQLHWAKTKMSKELVALGALRKHSFYYLLHLVVAICISCFNGCHSNLCMPSHCLLFYQCQISLCLLFIRVPVIASSASPDNPGYLPHLKFLNLITAAKSFLTMKSHTVMFQGVGHEHFCAPLLSCIHWFCIFRQQATSL